MSRSPPPPPSLSLVHSDNTNTTTLQSLSSITSQQDDLEKQLSTLPYPVQASITHQWNTFSRFSTEIQPLILQGLLLRCPLSHLSQLSTTLVELLRVDFLTNLPVELSLKILGYLDAKSICHAAVVCRSWKQLADDDRLWLRMCEQHIDKKCKKCGWGLPPMVQETLKNRIREEKSNLVRGTETRSTKRKRNEDNATGNVEDEKEKEKKMRNDEEVNEVVQMGILSVHQPSTTGSSSSTTSTTATTLPPTTAITIPIEPTPTLSSPMKQRPWKQIYAERTIVEKNWRSGKYTLRTITGHTDEIMCLQFNDHWQIPLLATGSYDKTIRVWNLETGECLAVLTGHNGCIRTLQFDEKKLLSGSMDNTIKVWNLRTGACIRTLEGHRDGVTSLHFITNDNQQLLVSGSADTTIRVWDGLTGNSYSLTGHAGWVNKVLIFDKTHVISSSDDMTIKYWDLTTRTCLRTFSGHVAEVQCFDARLGSLGQGVNEEEDNHLHYVESHGEDEDEELGLTPRPPLLVSGGLDNTIRVWNLTTGKLLQTLFGHLEGIWCISFDSLRIVSGAHDELVKIWDAETGKCMHTLEGHAGAVNCVGLSDTLVVSAGADRVVRIWDFGA